MGVQIQVSGEPTDEEAAAIAAAVMAYTAGGPAPDATPYAYRSLWRRAAINAGVRDEYDSWRKRVS